MIATEQMAEKYIILIWIPPKKDWQIIFIHPMNYGIKHFPYTINGRINLMRCLMKQMAAQWAAGFTRRLLRKERLMPLQKKRKEYYSHLQQERVKHLLLFKLHGNYFIHAGIYSMTENEDQEFCFLPTETF